MLQRIFASKGWNMVFGPFDNFLHMNIHSPVQIICYPSLHMFPKCYLSICLHMLIHCWKSIQGLDSGSKKPDKMSALKLLKFQRPGSRDLLEGKPLNGGCNALFMMAFRSAEPVFSLPASKEALLSRTSLCCHTSTQKQTFWWLQMDGCD